METLGQDRYLSLQSITKGKVQGSFAEVGKYLQKGMPDDLIGSYPAGILQPSIPLANDQFGVGSQNAMVGVFVQPIKSC